MPLFAPLRFPRCTLRPTFRHAVVALLVALLAACASRAPAPVEERVTKVPRTAPNVGALPPAPPVAESEPRTQTYTVKRGDMLYKIALDHGLDYRELAAWNGIENVNLIREGQVLRLTPPGEAGASASAAGAAGVTTAPLKGAPPVPPGVVGSEVPAGPGTSPTLAAAPPGGRNTDTYKTQPKALKEPYSEQALRDARRLAAASPPAQTTVAAAAPIAAPAAQTVASGPTAQAEAKPEVKPQASAADDDKLGWIWPTKGKLITGNSENPNLKGIDIAGVAGQPIVASAAGKVVYSGTGIRGYGKLIIVKHNATYLSAYAHNRDILVKEGQQVAKGQKIGEMGNTDSDQVKLHFEIRKHGTPMDPLKYLPPA
jgi:lipoprotein NlpD